MLHVRFNLISSDPQRLGDMLDYAQADVSPRVESQPGSLGVSLLANADLGLAIFESFWSSGDAMRASEQTVVPSRREMLRRSAGTVSVERYNLPVFEREEPPSSGGGLRLARLDVDPEASADIVEVYGSTAVPWLADTKGFCAAMLLVDSDSGHCITEAMWRRPEELVASRSVAAAVQAETASSTHGEVRAVEEYDVVYNSAQKPAS